MNTACATVNLASIPLLALGLLCAAAHGQEPAGFTSGALTFKPRLGLEVVRNDNIYTTPSDEIESTVLVQKPGLLIEVEPGRHRFELEYSGEFGQVDEDSTDDYDDHRFVVSALFDLGARHNIRVRGNYFDGHENRGSGLSRSETPTDDQFPVEPNEYNDRTAEVYYRFGASEATGRVEIGLGSRNREYDNNRSQTEFYDRSQDFANAAFFYRFRPGTYLVFDVQRKDVDYDVLRPGRASRDGEEMRYRAGVTWEPTGKTRGRASIGHVRKKFDDPARPDFSGISWEADIRWSPRTYSHFDFQTAREPVETLGEGDFMDTHTHRLTWSHDWSDSWQTRLGGQLQDEEFVGTERQEDLVEWSFDLRYRIRRWLTLGIGATMQSANSTIDSLEYDVTIYRIGIEFAP